MFTVEDLIYIKEFFEMTGDSTISSRIIKDKINNKLNEVEVCNESLVGVYRTKEQAIEKAKELGWLE